MSTRSWFSEFLIALAYPTGEQALPSSGDVTAHTEWAIRWSDGDLDEYGAGETGHALAAHDAEAALEHDPDDTSQLVRREVRTWTGPWTAARPT